METSYPTIAYNNTYGIQAINKTQYDAAINDFGREGGCKDMINSCHDLAEKSDPQDYGSNVDVDNACIAAGDFCSNQGEGAYLNTSNRGYYDIAHLNPDPFPPSFFIGFLNQAWVQKALGVPVNYTESSNAVGNGFTATGDYARGGFLEDLGYVLDNGIKVAMVYGDRDYACNCEQPSLHGRARRLTFN